MEKELLNSISKIKASKNKKAVLNSLHNSMKTPSEISSETGIIINHISNLLSELKKDNLIKCLNEDAKKGRLYILTEKGEIIHNKCE